MNAHDSERIKGMLESLGLGEAVAPDDADVVRGGVRQLPNLAPPAHVRVPGVCARPWR